MLKISLASSVDGFFEQEDFEEIRKEKPVENLEEH
jgi:hypothetical protein